MKIRFQGDPEPLAIMTGRLVAASRLWINGKLIFERGKVASSSELFEPYPAPNYAVFYSQQSELELVLQVANFSTAEVGGYMNLKIARERTANSYRTNLIIWDALIAGVMLIMSIYHFGVWALLRTQKAPLYFAIFCMTMGIRAITNGEAYLFYVMFPNVSLASEIKLEFSTVSIGILSASGFFYHLFPQDLSPKVVVISWIVGMLFTMDFLIVEPATAWQHLLILQLFLVVANVVLLWGIGKAVYHKREGSALILAGGFVLVLATIHDVLVSNKIISAEFILTPATAVFIVILSFMMSMSFSNTMKRLVKARQESVPDFFWSTRMYALSPDSPNRAIPYWEWA
jgi:hypothetical protein